MAKLKQALQRLKASNAHAKALKRKLEHKITQHEQKKKAQGNKARAAQPRKVWLPFNEFSQDVCYLLIGEGDFSFALSFVNKYPLNRVVATSLDSEEEVLNKYPTSLTNLDQLKEVDCEVLHSIDATQLIKNKFLKSLGAHNELVVVFNFPHLGNSVADQDRNIRQHQKLLLDFFKQCMLLKADNVIVTLFEGLPYDQWQPKQLARGAGLSLVRTGQFDFNEFEGYEHQLTSKVGKTNKEQGRRNARMYLFERADKVKHEAPQSDDD